MEAQNRDVLLREMQHRVKNNFQIILASIAIQKRRYSAGDAQRALDHIASRINAISLAHDQLAPREEGQIVKLSDYLRALCLSIKQQAEGIEVEVQADELELSIERAVPLGLILNEIATNSIKHAFGPEGGGRITVKLVAGVGYGEARLSVADNGRGIKEHNPTGSGLKLDRRAGPPDRRHRRSGQLQSRYHDVADLSGDHVTSRKQANSSSAPPPSHSSQRLHSFIPLLLRVGLAYLPRRAFGLSASARLSLAHHVPGDVLQALACRAAGASPRRLHVASSGFSRCAPASSFSSSLSDVLTRQRSALVLCGIRPRFTVPLTCRIRVRHFCAYQVEFSARRLRTTLDFVAGTSCLSLLPPEGVENSTGRLSAGG